MPAVGGGAGPMHVAPAAALYQWNEESKSRAEALAVISRIGQAIGRKNLSAESVFKVIDKNRDQMISPTEFNNLILKFEEGISAATLSIAFREFDRNSSGFIDLREFCAALERAGAPQATGIALPSAAEVKCAELRREVKHLQVGLEDLDELARRTGQDKDVPKREWPDISTWDIPTLEALHKRLTMEFVEKSEVNTKPASPLMPSLPDPDALTRASSAPGATSSGGAGGVASSSPGPASVASPGQSQADRHPLPSTPSGYPAAGQRKAASPKASSPKASSPSAAADAHTLGAVTAAAAAAAAPIVAGTRVEYLSVSQGKWMLATVLGFDAAAGTYTLDVKAVVYAHDVRMPEADVERCAPSVPTGPRRAPSVPAGSPSLPAMDLLGLDQNSGLRVNDQYHKSRIGPASDAHRDNVRNGTMDQVVKRLGLVAFGDDARCARSAPPTHKETTLFIDQSAAAFEGSAPAGGQNLLGRYDCIALRICADYDSNWKFIQGNRPHFWILHAAAVNIGENVRTSEITDFRKKGFDSLDEDTYLKAMHRIFRNVVLACSTLEAEHLVLFPFGMGAFLRNLHLLDATYKDERALQNLRCGIVTKLVQALEVSADSLPALRIHVCLGGGNLEAQCNLDAFIRGFRAASQSIKDRTQIWSGADAFQLSHELASTSSKVILLNGANRRLLGNHWFEGGARRAIDENLHRRSWMMSALAYLLNNYSCERTFANRKPHELRDNVQWLSGKVYKAS